MNTATKTCFIPSSATTTPRPTTPLKRLLLSDTERRSAVKTNSGPQRQKLSRQNTSSRKRQLHHLNEMQTYYNSYILESNSFNLDEMTLEELEQIAIKRHSAHKDRLERLYRDAMDLWTSSGSGACQIPGSGAAVVVVVSNPDDCGEIVEGGGGRDATRACRKLSSTTKKILATGLQAGCQGSPLDHLLAEYPLNSFATLALWHGDREKGRLVEDSLTS
ncbi:hypothetical protein BJ741DRAFT_593405 [Chytriomyces cf. hyalinus JEL632]|nr:hypothetical protein BJ741DRAFT_593405 [Chytriomyces cf. hyalinus JEL632]